MRSTLFRQEVLDTQSTAAMGAIVLAQPVPIRIGAMLAGSLFVFFLLLLCFGSYSRTITAEGKLVTSKGSIRVVAPQFGQVTRHMVEEGMLVQKGDALYEVSAFRISQRQNMEEKIQDSIARQRNAIMREWDVQLKLAGDKRKDLEERCASYSREMAGTTRAILLQRERLHTMEKIVEKYQLLRVQGYISDLQWNQIVNDHKKELMQENILETQQHQLQREFSQLKLALAEEDAQKRMANAVKDREIALLEQQSIEQFARSRTQIVAPVTGTITAQAIEEGTTVTQSQTVATIIPAGAELLAHLYIPSRSIGHIAQGQFVWLRVHSFAHQTFGVLAGTVALVESAPMLESGRESSIKDDSTFRVVIKLDAKAVKNMEKRANGKGLRPGMSVQAIINIEVLSLINILMPSVFR